jgi:hypothetical protein
MEPTNEEGVKIGMDPIAPQAKSNIQTVPLLDLKEEDIFGHYMAMMEAANKETRAAADKKWQENKREFMREARRYQWHHIYAAEIKVRKNGR